MLSTVHIDRDLYEADEFDLMQLFSDPFYRDVQAKTITHHENFGNRVKVGRILKSYQSERYDEHKALKVYKRHWVVSRVFETYTRYDDNSNPIHMYSVGKYNKRLRHFVKKTDVHTKYSFSYILNKEEMEDPHIFTDVAQAKQLSARKLPTFILDTSDFRMKVDKTIGLHLISDLESYYDNGENPDLLDTYIPSYVNLSETQYYLTLGSAIKLFKKQRIPLLPLVRGIGVLQAIMIFAARIFPKGVQYILLNTKYGTKVSARRMEFTEKIKENENGKDINMHEIFHFILDDPYSPTSLTGKSSVTYYLGYIHGLIKTAHNIINQKYGKYKYEEDMKYLNKMLERLYDNLIFGIRVSIVERFLKKFKRLFLNEFVRLVRSVYNKKLKEFEREIEFITAVDERIENLYDKFFAFTADVIVYEKQGAIPNVFTPDYKIVFKDIIEGSRKRVNSFKRFLTIDILRDAHRIDALIEQLINKQVAIIETTSPIEYFSNLVKFSRGESVSTKKSKTFEDWVLLLIHSMVNGFETTNDWESMTGVKRENLQEGKYSIEMINDTEAGSHTFARIELIIDDLIEIWKDKHEKFCKEYVNLTSEERADVISKVWDNQRSVIRIALKNTLKYISYK